MQPLIELQVNIKYDPKPPVTRRRPRLTCRWKIGMRATWMFSCLCVFQFHISGDYEIQVLLSRGGKELCGFTFRYKYCNK